MRSANALILFGIFHLQWPIARTLLRSKSTPIIVLIYPHVQLYEVYGKVPYFAQYFSQNTSLVYYSSIHIYSRAFHFKPRDCNLVSFLIQPNSVKFFQSISKPICLQVYLCNHNTKFCYFRTFALIKQCLT